MLLVRHTLDVMHCEKNVCENIMKTLFGEKDTAAVRNDMREVNIRPNLWLQPSDSARVGEVIKPPAPYCLTEVEKVEFIDIIRKLKTPTNYVGALSRKIHSNGTLRGLKSHDYHILMQQIMPLCLRDLMDRGPRMAIIKVGRIFQRICSKIIDPSSAQSLREDTAIALCLLEKEFPPSFFDPMTHLLVHLVEELDMCGPVHCRWMYPMERYMKALKGFVRNKARPEGGMAEGYALEEALGFCTEYMVEFQSTRRRVWDNKEEDRVADEVPEGSGRPRRMEENIQGWAHNYIVNNSTCMDVWRR